MDTLAKTTTGSEILDPNTITAYDAIMVFMQQIQSSMYTAEQKQQIIHTFEDAINPISGALQTISSVTLDDIRTKIQSAVNYAASIGFTVNIVSTMLVSAPPEYLVGKTLGNYTGTVSTAVETDTTIQTTDVTTSEFTLVDTAISEIAAPISTYSIINANLLPIITAVANSSSLQTGLNLISKNPIANTIANTKSVIFYYTENRYANLNSTLATVAADGSLSTQYALYKDAIGGGDGLSGAIAQLDSFQEHTDRISGLKLESENEFAEQTDDSVLEQFYYNNLADSSDIIIGNFNARYYRSAIYHIQATAGSEHQLTEMLVIHDNNLAYARVVDDVYTIDPFVTYNVALSGGKVNIYANTSIANTDLVIQGSKIQIAKDASSPERMSQFKILDNHSILTAYYNDGTDYAGLQTQSLTKSKILEELGREVIDSVSVMSSSNFAALSTASKQSYILNVTAAINNKSQSLQDSIDADYAQYQLAEKKAEAIRIIQQLSSSYTDPTAKALVDATTLDSVKEYL